MKNEKIISVTNLFQHLSSANQCKKQAKSKVPSKILSLYNFFYAKNKLGSQIYTIQIYVCFIRLENLVYENNLIVITDSNTIGQSSTQHAKLNQGNITK